MVSSEINFVLPISLGRTGSTLLMGMLNSFSEVLVRGENYLFCYDLMLATQKLEASKVHLGNSSKDAWFGSENLDSERFLENLRNAVLDELIGSAKNTSDLKWTGFKEIRYFDLESDQLFDFLVFLNRLFPNVHFIHHTRDYSQTANSGWWQEYRPDLLANKMRSFDTSVSDILSSCFPDRTFHSSFENMTRDSDHYYQSLADFLQLKATDGRAEQVLSEVYSSKTTIFLTPEQRVIDPNK